MAKNLWRVEGTFVRNGKKEIYDDIHEAPSASKAKSVAMTKYSTYTRAGYEPKASFGKLTINKVTPFKHE